MSLRWSTTLIVTVVANTGAVLWVSQVLPNVTGVMFGGVVAASLIAGIVLWVAGAVTHNKPLSEIAQGLVLGAVLGFLGGFVSCFALIANMN